MGVNVGGGEELVFQGGDDILRHRVVPATAATTQAPHNAM